MLRPCFVIFRHLKKNFQCMSFKKGNYTYLTLSEFLYP